MSNGLYYYKLQSEYSEDVTKNCKLTINEIDSNFKSLKDEDIAKAEFDRETKTLILTRKNKDKLIVDLSDVTYDLKVNSNCTESGQTITVSYDGKDGKEEFSFNNLITYDNLKGILDNVTLTHVIHDGTLKGDGTMRGPLGISGTEKTGVLAPVQAVYDITNGEKLPKATKLGTRYLTVEYVNDYGYLYNYQGVQKIANQLKVNNSCWRIPTKDDWDKLLDSIEPCEYRNHTSAKCHAELGKFAGKFLKSECGWIGEEDCECSSTEPMSHCTSCSTISDDIYVDTDSSSSTFVPTETIHSANGVDKFGFTILPCGHADINTYNQPSSYGYKEEAVFWTSTNVYDDTAQDYYTKQFYWNKGGVVQEAPCPNMYYSVRLVKDYNGENDFSSEYIDGVIYTTRAFPKSGQVWLTANYAQKEGFIGYTMGGTTPEYTEVNNGQIRNKRKVMFINEFNGRFWERRMLNEGDTVIVETPCEASGETVTKQICWQNKDEACEICVDVEIPIIPQFNTEYRVYTTDNCNQTLVNTDDIVTERVLDTVVPLVYNETVNRKKAIEKLDKKIEEEMAERYKNDSILAKAINAETATRISGDTELFNAINEEIAKRTYEDGILLEKINTEADTRKEEDDKLTQAINAERIARMTGDKNLQDQIDAWIESGHTKHDELVKMIDEETERAKAAEQALQENIDAETERAQAAEQDLSDKLAQETKDREEADKVLQANIDDEAKAREDKDTEIYGKLPQAGNDVTFTLSASAEKGIDNLTIPSNDGSNTIKVVFDGNFGEI